MKTAHTIYALPKLKKGLCRVGQCKGKLHGWGLCQGHFERYYPGIIPGSLKPKQTPWWKEADWNKTNGQIAVEFKKTPTWVSIIRRKKSKQKAKFSCKLSKA